MKNHTHSPKSSRTQRFTALAAVILSLAGSAFGQTATVPFDLPQFRDALAGSRLQSPSTSKAEVRDGKFQGFSLPGRFFLAEDGSTMVLATTTDGRDRSEIRHNGNWSVSGPEKRLTADLRFDKPTSLGKARLHVAQIHIQNFLGNKRGPLLMVTWMENRSGKQDHIWATVRQDFLPDSRSHEVFDLGPRPNEFTTLDIRVENGILRIFVGGELKLEDDVSEFAAAPCYFKTGSYHRDLKAHQVEFKSLTIQTP